MRLTASVLIASQLRRVTIRHTSGISQMIAADLPVTHVTADLVVAVAIQLLVLAVLRVPHLLAAAAVPVEEARAVAHAEGGHLVVEVGGEVVADTRGDVVVVDARAAKVLVLAHLEVDDGFGGGVAGEGEDEDEGGGEELHGNKGLEGKEVWLVDLGGWRTRLSDRRRGTKQLYIYANFCARSILSNSQQLPDVKDAELQSR